MGAKTAERMARLSDLSLNHQKNVHKIDMVNRDEETRRLKLRLLSLRDEKASLKDKLAQKDSRISLLAGQGDEVRTELEEAREKLRTQDVKFKKQSNELATLKAELDALNGTMEDSSKILQEKFALNRELNRIRPEIEHLKSQLANHQAVISEKHELQRQLNSLEVELENEKRSKQRIQQKQHAEVDDDWRAQVEDAEKKHKVEKKEWERSKKKFESELREGEGEREQLVDRVEGLKAKLKSVQSELKDAREEVKGCRAEMETMRKAPRASDQLKKMVPTKGHAASKRRFNDASMEDISIGTPGPDLAAQKRPLKKRGAEFSLLGEKSAFSVTPFLSRTKNVDDDSLDMPSPTGKQVVFAEPVVDEEEEVEEGVQQPKFHAQAVEETAEADKEVKTKTSKAQKARGRPRKALEDAPTLKKNMPSTSAQEKTQQVKTKHPLAAVVEEESEDDETEKVKKVPEHKAKKVELKSGHGTAAEADGRKKKRKILANSSKTLFDDEDAEMAPKVPKTKLGAGRKLKGPLGGVAGAFGGRTFSPLKRDRRGVNASFLA